MNKSVERDKRKEKGVVKYYTKNILKGMDSLTSDRNNGHHSVGLLPDCCVPAGMQKRFGGGTVIIKDLSAVELIKYYISRDVEIIQEQIEYAIDEIYDLKNAAEACKSVFKDYSEEEVKQLPPSVQFCWKEGQKLMENEASDKSII